METSPFVFAKIIGPEKEGDTALSDCVSRLKNTFKKNFIEKQNDIPFDCIIYLIAHGKSPLHNLKAGIDYSDNTSKYILGEIKQLLNHLKEFRGKIILQMCHSAQPMVDKQTMKNALQISKSGVQNYYDQYCKLKIVLGSSSLLVEVHQGLRNDGTLGKKFANDSKLGGYLGLSNDGDFTKTGYSKASTYHPLTEKYQRSRGVQNQRTKTGVDYNETESHLQVYFNQKEPYGKVQ